MQTRRNFAFAVLLGLVAAIAPSACAAGKPVIFAAASLKNALDAVSLAWSASSGQEVTISYAASSALAKQIEQGAPADVFVSADLAWLQYLADQQLIRAGTAVNILGNELVLVAPAGAMAKADLTSDLLLAALIGDSKLAMADVTSVPAGKYGKAALESLGLWSAVESKVAQTDNVRAALKLVASGEAALGIVYRTDALAEPLVDVVGAFPEDSHPPIVYPAALTATASEDAAAFFAFLRSPAARTIFEVQGFIVLTPVLSN